MVSNNPLSVDEYGFVAKTSCTWCWRSDLCRLRYSLIFTGTYIVYNGNKDMKKTRRPGGGRKPSKPEYSAAKNLTQQMKAATELYTEKMSLQAIADALSLNPIKARKLLITAGVYKSDTGKARPADVRFFQKYAELFCCCHLHHVGFAVVPSLCDLLSAV